MAYSAEQKIQAVQTIKRLGGLTDDAIQAARDLLNAQSLSKSTLHGWVKQFGGDIEKANQFDNRTEPIRTDKKNGLPTEKVAELVKRTDEALDAMFERIARKALVKAEQDDKLSAMSSKDLVITAATSVDKMRLLRDLPTEIIGVIPTLLKLHEVLKADGRSAGDALEVWLSEYVSEKERLNAEHVQNDSTLQGDNS